MRTMDGLGPITPTRQATTAEVSPIASCSGFSVAPRAEQVGLTFARICGLNSPHAFALERHWAYSALA